MRDIATNITYSTNFINTSTCERNCVCLRTL